MKIAMMSQPRHLSFTEVLARLDGMDMPEDAVEAELASQHAVMESMLELRAKQPKHDPTEREKFIRMYKQLAKIEQSMAHPE